MKPGLCEKHGVQPFTSTSPRLAAAIAQGEVIDASEIRKLIIESLDQSFEYWVDNGFLEQFEVRHNEMIVTLKDRDKSSKLLNDRLTIRKIVGGMKWVCSVCLKTVVK